MTQTSDHDKLLFNVQRSARYHDRRESYFNGLSNISLFLGTVYGSAAAVAFLSNFDYRWVLVTVGFIVSIIAGWSLVIGAGNLARTHATLRRRFIDLERRMERKRASWNDDTLAEFTGERLLIEADEPPVRQVLNMICYNEQLQAQGYRRSDLVKVGRFQSIFAHFWDIGADRLEDAKV